MRKDVKSQKNCRGENKLFAYIIMAMLAEKKCEIITKYDIDIIFDNFASALESETFREGEELTRQEEIFIQQNFDKLDKMFDYFGLTLNKDNFNEMIRKILFSMPMNQNGGVTERNGITEVESPNRKKSFIRNDLYAIVSLLFGFFMLFLAFIQLNQILIDTTGSNIGELNKKLITEITATIKSVPQNDLPFFAYVYDVFHQVCSNIGSDVQKAFSSNATKVMTYTIQNFSTEAIKICSTKQTGVLGLIDGIIKTVIDLGGTQNCVIEQQKILFDRYTRELAYEASKQLTTQSMAFQHLTRQLWMAGAGLGGPAVRYLIYRLRTPASQQLLMNEDGRSLSIRGGTKRASKKRGGTKRGKKQSKKTKKRNSKSIKKHKKK